MLGFSLTGQNDSGNQKEDEAVLTDSEKQKKIDFSIGMISGFTYVVQAVRFNDRFFQVNSGYTRGSVGAKANVNAIINPKNQLGLTVDFSLVQSNSTSFNVGLRYVYRQPENQRNIVLYNPIEVLYSSQLMNLEYSTTDTLLPYSIAYVFIQEKIQSRVQSITLSYGFGIELKLATSRTIKLEFALVQSFGFSHDYLSYERQIPDEKINQTGVRLGVLYDL